ncbi:MAG: signal peptidase I [bacterium P3]|nr:MAG: signal peptidase I [bacterium P3]KWW42053.1 MAG: signal peptidase I [bacterium F083]
MLFEIYRILYFLGVTAGLWLLFRKAGVAPWKSLIPVYRVVVWIRLCGKGWRWYLYFLIPAVNVFAFLLLVVETAKMFQRYSFWEQAFAVVFPWIYLPLAGGNPRWAYIVPAERPPHRVGELRDWLDSIVFALVAAVIIRGHIFELYNIPSSSMEKSLLVGDNLLVSKAAYGPRAAVTPLSMPLVHNVLPFTGGQVESYLKWLQLPYHRYAGWSHVRRFDAVVFNYPDGDTVCTAWQSNRSYHDLVREEGREAVLNSTMMNVGGTPVPNKIRVRPVDKRENFIKRCIGLPGECLEIRDQQVYINGQPVENPAHLQFQYAVLFRSDLPCNPRHILSQAGVSEEDYANAVMQQRYEGIPHYIVPLSRTRAQELSRRYEVDTVQPLVFPAETGSTTLFPHDGNYGWSVDNFGPVHIPAKNEVLELSLQNLPLYRRLIEVFEGNSLEVREGQIFINGEAARTYKVKMNYYWMMGDNRHNSADSRYWGFVPEDHIVGRAAFVLWSRDKDSGKMRWHRFFKSASAID